MSPLWSNIGSVAAALALILVNGFFVAAEFALVKIRDTQLQPLVRQGHRRARLARRILQQLDPYLGACQLGITVASIGLGVLGEPAMEALLDPLFRKLGVSSGELRHALAFGIGYGVITFLHIVVGEQAPKFMALQRSLSTSLWAAYPLDWFYRLSYPFIVVVNKTSFWLMRQMGIPAQDVHGSEHSEDELRIMLSQRPTPGDAGALGREIVLNAFDLNRRLARDVMRPRNEIVALNTDATIEECLDVAERSRYSRLPLCSGGHLDRTVGVVHFKDLVAQRNTAKTGADLLPVSRRLIYVPETARLDKLLGLFLDRKSHFAMVVDEYGGTAGVITLENCLEELVGQIQDEHDQERPRVTQRSANEWEIDGSLPLFEFADLVGQPVTGDGVTTVGGWVMQRLGGFPKRGDAVAIGRSDLSVTEIAGVRVVRLLLRRAPQSSDTTFIANPSPPAAGDGGGTDA